MLASLWMTCACLSQAIEHTRIFPESQESGRLRRDAPRMRGLSTVFVGKLVDILLARPPSA
jgi:hypothetical protein